MKDSLPQQIARFYQNHRRKHLWYRIVSGLACVVVFCTVYALILPAITMEKEPLCGLEEHTHSEECYGVETVWPDPEFLCEEELSGCTVVHTHDSLCYNEAGELVCPLPELEAHRHDGSCYEDREVLSCGEEETGHRHDEDCYTRCQGELLCELEESEGHSHDSGCYETSREFVCDLEEDEEHIHDDDCWEEYEELVCDLEETEGHTHDGDCYDWTEELTCGIEETEGHIHDESCYTTETVLVCREEEVILHTHGEDCFDGDGVLICGLPEVTEHRHTRDCVVMPEGDPEEVTVLVCGLEEHIHSDSCYEEEPPAAGGGGAAGETETICGLPEHIHDDACYDETGTLVCGFEEHTHSDECYTDEKPGAGGGASAETEALCGLPEHTHDDACYDETGALICGLEEHTHSLDCLAEEDRSQIMAVIALIDALPSTEEIEETLNAYEEAGDEAGYEAYFSEISDQARETHDRYETLETAHQAMVSNRDKLMDLSWLWSAAVLALPADTVKVTTSDTLKAAIADGDPYIQLDGAFSVGSTLTVPAASDITLDLNGHTLTATGTGALFSIPSSAGLTIMDSKQKSEIVETASGSLAGNTASLSNGTLTYYVTTTEVTNSATGATEETLEKHTVTAAGAIVGGSQPVFSVTGGTLNVQSGIIRGGTGRAIVQTGGETNLSGGYLCGFTQSSGSTANTNAFGGAIRAGGGALNLSGAVLAANTAQNGGAIYVTDSMQISITGGVISGNTANRVPTNGWDGHSENGTYRCGGGGIYADGNAEITMSSGYLTNNEATDTGYFDGGGGVCLSGASAMALSGGYVTGNQAQGGGGIRTDFGKETTFIMTGGFVSSNVATHAEGGGVTIDRNGVGTITGGYVTNNRIPHTVHWGGGGLFCADGSTLNLKQTLITGNAAGGWGGGVAGCPTGKIYLYITEGCAIYDNTDAVDDDSPHFVNGGVKNDIDINRCTEVFQANGHADYFCALNSTVTGTMLGNHAANWQGSADYQAVIADAEDLLSATEVMGLEAHPTEAGKAAAEAAARVYVNGNYSYTHGGGILCNGNLIIGVPVNIEVPARVELQATKKLTDSIGNEKDLENNDFSFKVTMTEPDGTVVANGVCDSNGTITFDHQLTFKQEGTFVYYVCEEADGGNPSIAYDPTLYRLTMTVTKDNGVAWYGDTIKYTYSVTSVKVERSGDGGTSWTQGSQSSTSQSGVITLPLTSGAAFTNRLIEPTKVTVRKVWEGGSGTDSVTVILKRDGEEFDRQILNADNEWSYTWDDLETGHIYSVEEEEVPGYTAGYEVTTETDSSGSTSLGQGSWWVPASSLTAGQQYLIVSPDGTKALYIASGNEGQGFNTADVTSVVQQQTALTVNGQAYATWYQAADIPARSIYNAEALTRNSHSGIILKRSDGGSYPYLRLESNNNNYLKGGSATGYASFMVFDGIYLRGHNLAEWTPDNLRTLIYADGKFNSTTEQTPDNAVRLYTLVSGEGFTGASIDSSTVVITNTYAGGIYELPETGGPGIPLYTMGGLSLMAGALLLYSIQDRKKGRRDRPC